MSPELYYGVLKSTDQEVPKSRGANQSNPHSLVLLIFYRLCQVVLTLNVPVAKSGGAARGTWLAPECCSNTAGTWEPVALWTFWCQSQDHRANSTGLSERTRKRRRRRLGRWGCTKHTGGAAGRGSVRSRWLRTERVPRRGAATEAPVVPSCSLSDPPTWNFFSPPPPPPLMPDETPRSLHKVHGSCLDFRPWMFDLALFVCCRQTRGTAASPRVGTRTKKTQGSQRSRKTSGNFWGGGWMERTSYLSQVPIAVFFRYPLGHHGSAAYPDRPVVGVNPSFAWRGRKAETERQDAQQASSPSGVADHLPSLFTRLFSSSSSSADRQTTKLLFSPSNTFIDTQLSGQKHRER